MTDDFIDSKIKDKMKDNSKCIDCNAEDPRFISINNSVFVCSRCAGFHLSLGNEVSFIKNVEDQFEEEEIKYIDIGGNLRFLTNLQEFELIKIGEHYSEDEEHIKNKYIFTASEYYRQLLRSEVEQNDKPEKPNREQAQTLIEFNADKSNIDNAQDPEKKKGLFEKFNNLFTSAIIKTKTIIKGTGKKIEKMDFKNKLKIAGGKTVTAMKGAGKFLKSKAIKVKNTIGSKFADSQIEPPGVSTAKDPSKENKDES